MRLTDIQVAGLRALAAAHQETPTDDWSDKALLEFGKIQGRAELARELLQEAAHRGANADLDCDLTGATRR